MKLKAIFITSEKIKATHIESWSNTTPWTNDVNLVHKSRLLDALCKFNLYLVQRGEVILSKVIRAFIPKRTCKPNFLLAQLFPFYWATNQNGEFLPTSLLIYSNINVTSLLLILRMANDLVLLAAFCFYNYFFKFCFQKRTLNKIRDFTCQKTSVFILLKILTAIYCALVSDAS